jgi:transcription elongation factor GreA
MKYPITREGYDSLKKDLEYLRNTKRPKILLAIEEARAHGDISENAEYDAAKEEYQFLQKKMGEIEEMLKQCEIAEIKRNPNGVVDFGGRVALKNLDTDEEVAYTVVGPYESDIERGRISMSSPLGRALLGKGVGDEVCFSAPGGERTYEIIKVSWPGAPAPR